MTEPVATVGKLDDIQCIRSRVSRILKYQYRNTFEHGLMFKYQQVLPSVAPPTKPHQYLASHGSRLTAHAAHFRYHKSWYYHIATTTDAVVMIHKEIKGNLDADDFE